MLNKQGPGKIDWTDYTWNPISGCHHDCSYCYMKRMEKRFPGIMEPKFKPESIKKFQKNRKLKPGDKIFVGSSGDMWGNWMTENQISAVLIETLNHPENIFQFLTKNPKRYNDFHLESVDNCWYGTTVDGTAFTRNNMDDLIRATAGAWTRFVSFEPLIQPVSQHDLSNICLLDWIIIGADSTRGAARPPKQWADCLINEARKSNVPVFVKDNYGYPEKIKEFPGSIEIRGKE
ncbi:MAG: DUF5131 family protein [Desulfobacteraceae bacterium]|nr:DUF5131 family protein [Desulfobacteraceae bacterium]